MYRYDYTNTPWAVAGSLVANGSSGAKFKRGFEISTKHYPLESLVEEWQIPVTLGKDAEERLGVEGEVVLLLRTGPIVILRSDSRTWQWEMNTIRRFGYTTTSFHFEAGRRSQTGEGVFTFLTDKGNRIYQKVTEMKEYFQIDLLCQKGMSLEQILHLSLGEDLAQPNCKLGRGSSLRNKSFSLRSVPLENKTQASTRSRSASQPELNVTLQSRPVTLDPTATLQSRPVTLDPTATLQSRPVTLDPTAMPRSRPVTLDPTATPRSRPVTLDPTATPRSRPVTLDPIATPRSRPVTMDPTATPRSRPVTKTLSGDSAKPLRGAQTLPRRRNSVYYP